MQILINYIDTLVAKYADDNRLSVSFVDQESADAVFPELIPNASVEKTEDQLILKYKQYNFTRMIILM